MSNKPMLIIVGPSGVGKSSFVEKAMGDYSNDLVDTVTYTTRSMRAGESEGFPYHFVNRLQFEKLIDKGFFVEWAEVHGNLYGTPTHQINEAWEAGKVIIMDVDVQGAKTFKSKYPQAQAIFILPPSIEALRQRIIKREGKAPSDLELRMQNAEIEMDLVHEFDGQIVNENFDEAYAQLQKMIENLIKKR